MDDSIGFIGLGTMGGPMAANLLQAGKNLVVHDICPETEKPLCEQGATWTDDITDMRKQADVIISSLPGPKEIEQVRFSANGLVLVPDLSVRVRFGAWPARGRVSRGRSTEQSLLNQIMIRLPRQQWRESDGNHRGARRAWTRVSRRRRKAVPYNYTKRAAVSGFLRVSV